MNGTTIRPLPPHRDVEPMLSVWRCPKCNTILAKIRLTAGSILEIKCSRCNTMAIREAS